MYPKPSNIHFFLFKDVFSFARLLNLGYGSPLRCFLQAMTSLRSEFGTLPAPAPLQHSVGWRGGTAECESAGPGLLGGGSGQLSPGEWLCGSWWEALWCEARAGGQQDSWAGQEVGQLRPQTLGPRVLIARKVSAGVNPALSFPHHAPPLPHILCPPALRAGSYEGSADHSVHF